MGGRNDRTRALLRFRHAVRDCRSDRHGRHLRRSDPELDASGAARGRVAGIDNRRHPAFGLRVGRRRAHACARGHAAGLPYRRRNSVVPARDRHGVRAASGIHAPTVPEREEARRRDDVAVFPLAFPLIAGPGALTSIVLLMSRAPTTVSAVEILGALAVVLALTLAALLQARRLARLLGVTGGNVGGGGVGVILAAI